jgi:trigger factor
VVDPDGPEPAPGFANQLIGVQAGDSKTFTLNMPDDYRDKEVAGKPAEFSITLHWVKERELPTLDNDFAQQVGDYTDLAGLRSAIEAQLRQREDERMREKLEEDSMSKLVEISSIEFPPQLVEHQTQHMLETFTRSIERQGMQLSQYLRMIGKQQDEFEQELREQAEVRVRRSLALDAFADAEKIATSDSPSDEDAESRASKALAKLVELATGDARNGSKVSAEKTAEPAQTSDTGSQAPQEEQGIA